MARADGIYAVRFVGMDTWGTARWFTTEDGGFWDVATTGGEHFQFLVHVGDPEPDLFAEIGAQVG